MMIGLRSDPEATLFLTCQRASFLHLPTPIPIVYLRTAYVISLVSPRSKRNDTPGV